MVEKMEIKFASMKHKLELKQLEDRAKSLSPKAQYGGRVTNLKLHINNSHSWVPNFNPKIPGMENTNNAENTKYLEEKAKMEEAIKDER